MSSKTGDIPPYLFRAFIAKERRCDEISAFMNDMDHRERFNNHCVDYHPVVELEILAPHGNLGPSGFGFFCLHVVLSSFKNR